MNPGVNPMPYNENDFLLYHFYQHAVFGLSKDIPRFDEDKNYLEKAGDVGLWCLENLPSKLVSVMKNPSWLTVVITNLALIATSFAFYPKETKEFMKAVWVKLPVPSQETIKFAAYLVIVANIISFSMRALGRFQNSDLMNKWYHGGALHI